MSVTSGFFDSDNHDRVYTTLQMSSIFDGVITDGVYMHIGKHLSVRAGTGLEVIVAPGRAWFDHTWTHNDSDFPISIPSPEVVLDRIDAIVLEVNHTQSVRANVIKCIKGSPSSEPVKPEMTNTKMVHQHPLCYIRVKHAVNKLENADIENTIGTTECPFVSGINEGINIDELVQQWQSQFEIKLAELQKSIDQVLQGVVPDGSVSSTYRITIPTTGWSESEGDSVIDLRFPGIKETDDPIVKPDIPSINDDGPISDAWGNIWKIETLNDRIIVHSHGIPQVPVTISAKCIRK